MSEFNLSVLIMRGVALLLGLRAMDLLNQILMAFHMPQDQMGEYLVRFSLWFIVLATLGLLVWFYAPRFGRWMLRGLNSGAPMEPMNDAQGLQLKYTLYACVGFFILSAAINPIMKLITVALRGGIAVDYMIESALFIILGGGLIFARCITGKCAGKAKV